MIGRCWFGENAPGPTAGSPDHRGPGGRGDPRRPLLRLSYQPGRSLAPRESVFRGGAQPTEGCQRRKNQWRRPNRLLLSSRVVPEAASPTSPGAPSRTKEPVMPVAAVIHLFAKPSQEMGKHGEHISAQDLRNLADDLHKKINHIADAVARLTGSGWLAEVAQPDVSLSNPHLTTVAEARTDIQGLGLNPDDFHIHEIDEGEYKDEDFGEFRGSGFQNFG